MDLHTDQDPAMALGLVTDKDMDQDLLTDQGLPMDKDPAMDQVPSTVQGMVEQVKLAQNNLQWHQHQHGLDYLELVNIHKIMVEP